MSDPYSFRGRGWSFPPKLDPKTGRVELVSGLDDIRQAIRIILGTSRGERVMRPSFGCGAEDQVFEALDAATIGAIEQAVREALLLFEPRIEVEDVVSILPAGTDGRVDVRIEYRIRSVNRRDNLVYPFYLRGRS
ncbi:MAG: GPW/gp25 family protein [Planctomycetes bacterium]|nr:GPW/gp25 family protein [Planctomycetota bacterium]